MRNRFAVALLAVVLAPGSCDASWGEPLAVKYGGFADMAFAYGLRSDPARNRAFTTQPARHGEFGVNLAHLESVVSGERVRGRLAFQAGTSVESNYAGERGTLSRHIQEAVAGYRVSEKLWVDGGVYLSHIGLESWISRDNWGYTRLLMSDYSPYYQSGVKASYRWSDAVSGQLHVLNGWQNISENNENKALGAQVSYAPAGGWSATYNNFWGQEVGNQGRFFNNLVLKAPAFGRLQMAASADYGVQKKPSGTGGFSKWYAGALLGRWAFTERVSGTARVERYVDEDQVIVNTGGRGSFRTTGASVNVDVALHTQLLWRTEVRGLWSENPVYPRRGSGGFAKDDALLATSLGMTF